MKAIPFCVLTTSKAANRAMLRRTDLAAAKSRLERRGSGLRTGGGETNEGGIVGSLIALVIGVAVSTTFALVWILALTSNNRQHDAATCFFGVGAVMVVIGLLGLAVSGGSI